MVTYSTMSGTKSALQSLAARMKAKALFENPIIDLRPWECFKQKHLIQSASFPVEFLESRMHELPVRTIPLSLVGEHHQIEQAEKFLFAKGYQIAVKQLIDSHSLDDDYFPEQIEIGEHSTRLWQPSEVAARFCREFQSQCKNKRGLDLACGAGRDSLYFASENWQMTAVDSSVSALEKLKESAFRSSQSVECIELDLEKGFESLLTRNRQYDLVIVVRYLHRPILGQIKHLISDYGFIVYQTFMRGSELFGSPKNPRYLLEENELASVFCDFKVMVNEITLLNDGRPTNSFIAQKIPNRVI